MVLKPYYLLAFSVSACRFIVEINVRQKTSDRINVEAGDPFINDKKGAYR